MPDEHEGTRAESEPTPTKSKRRLTKETKKAKKEKDEPRTFTGRLWRNWIKPIGIAALLVFSFRSTFADWNDVPSPSMEPTILIGDRVFVNKVAYDLKIPFTKIRLASWAQPQRGDIVIWFREDDGTRMVKRVIGVPGDLIEMRDNTLFVNGQQVETGPAPDDEFIKSHKLATLSNPKYVDKDGDGRKSDYLFFHEALGDHEYTIMKDVDDAQTLAAWFNSDRIGEDVRVGAVPEGHFFFMGDNRDNSNDSRGRDFTFVPMRQIVGKVTGVAFSFDRTTGSWAPRWDRFFSGLE